MAKRKKKIPDGAKRKREVNYRKVVSKLGQLQNRVLEALRNLHDSRRNAVFYLGEAIDGVAEVLRSLHQYDLAKQVKKPALYSDEKEIKKIRQKIENGSESLIGRYVSVLKFPSDDDMEFYAIELVKFADALKVFMMYLVDEADVLIDAYDDWFAARNKEK